MIYFFSSKAAAAVCGLAVAASLALLPCSCRDDCRSSREATPRRDGFRTAESADPIAPVELPCTLEPGDRAIVVGRHGANVVVALARAGEELVAPRGFRDRDAWYVDAISTSVDATSYAATMRAHAETRGIAAANDDDDDDMSRLRSPRPPREV